jgi:hypothetical protein
LRLRNHTAEQGRKEISEEEKKKQEGAEEKRRETQTMCYYEMSRWRCGFWKWGKFRQQCNKEYRTGETCGMKLVYMTLDEADTCRLCHDIEKKERRLDKMRRDIDRWYREGNRTATIERTTQEMEEVTAQVARKHQEHWERLSSIS